MMDLTKIEDRIVEYQQNCQEQPDGTCDPKCRLSGAEQGELNELSHLAICYKNGVLSAHLRKKFLDHLENVKTGLDQAELIKRLIHLGP